MNKYNRPIPSNFYEEPKSEPKNSFDHEPTKPSPWDVWLAKQVKEKTTNAEGKVTQLNL